MEDKISELEKEVAAIKERNLRVEADKAWEVSGFRIITLLIITYCIATLIMYLIGAKDVFLNALVPTIGFLLSTLALPGIKRWWIKRYYGRS